MLETMEFSRTSQFVEPVLQIPMVTWYPAELERVLFRAKTKLTA